MSSRSRRRARERRQLDKASYGAQARAIGARTQDMSAQANALATMQQGQQIGPYQPLPRNEPYNAPFGPLYPLQPYGIDPLRPDGRTDPRQFEYEVGHNIPGAGSRPIPFSTLREASRVDIVQDCMRVIRSELCGFDWGIVISEKAIAAAAEQDGLRQTEAKVALRDKLAPQLARAQDFWESPDPGSDAPDFSAWLWKMMEDVLALDASAVFPQLTFGNDLYALWVVDASCYSDDTEILTDNGWKLFRDVDMNADRFATRNPKTQAFEWQWAHYFHEAMHSEPLYHFHSRGVDLLVTGNHRMLVESKPHLAKGAERHGREWLIPASELVAAGGDIPRIPFGATWDAPDREEFLLPATSGHSSDFRISGDDYAALMGMYLSEGHTDKRGKTHGKYHSTVVISQMPYAKGYVEYKAVLERILGRPAYETGRAFLVYHRALAEYLHGFGKSWEKSVPWDVLDLSARQLEIFLHYYWLGDGTLAKGQRTIATTSPAICGSFQEIAAKLGMSASVGVRDGSVHQKYEIALRTSKNAKLTHCDRVPYEGKVYCVSVPNETLYVRRNGKPAWCGNTIKPLINNLGRRPAPPDPAFQQFEYGFPRAEFQTPAGPDAEGVSADELIYNVRNLRPHSVWGLSPVENALVRINLWLKRTQFMTNQFDTSSLPLAFLEVPETFPMRPEDLRRWRDTINSQLSGDLAERQRIQVGLPGAKLSKFADSSELYKPEYDTYIVKLVCASFGITPAEIGFIETGGLGGASYHEGQENIQYRKLLLPWCRWLEGIFNRINRRYLGLDAAVEFRFLGLEEEDEAAADAVVLARVQSGRMTLNEARDQAGMAPYADMPEADEPYILSRMGPQFLRGLQEQQEAQGEAVKAGAEMAKQNLEAGKLPSGKDPNTPTGERADGDEPTPDEGSPDAGSKPDAAKPKADAKQSGDAQKPVKGAEKSASVAELDSFARWAQKLAKGQAKIRPFAFTALDDSTARTLNHLVLDDAAADAASLAKATAAELRKQGGGGGRVESPRPDRGAGGMARLPSPRPARPTDGGTRLPGCAPDYRC